MLEVGIDPGLTGGISAVHEGQLLFTTRMPTEVKTHGRGRKVDCHVLSNLVEHLIGLRNGPLRITLEQVGSMPKQGVASSFSFGYSAGAIEGVVASFHLPYRFIKPQAWKRHHGLLRADKKASITLARRYFPDAKLSEGEAEAALMALVPWTIQP